MTVQANILVSASGKACIGDFGLSSVTDMASICQKGNDASSSYFCGSANWAAPEVLQSGQLSVKSDIYAFACVVYEVSNNFGIIANRSNPSPSFSQDMRHSQTFQTAVTRYCSRLSSLRSVPRDRTALHSPTLSGRL